jgi:phosphoglycolate phosphatase
VQFCDTKLIVFDFDGTIAKTTRYAVRFFEKFTEKKIDPRKYFGPPTRVVVKNLIKDYNLKITEEKFYNDWNKLYLPYVSKKKIITKETVKTIRKLKEKGYRLAIITSSRRYKLSVLMHKELWSYFDAIMGSEDYKIGKPDPESLNNLLLKMKIKKSNCVYIGDNIVDVFFAKNVGVKSIGKEDYLYTEKELKKAGADKTIKSIKDLLKLF